MNSGLRGILNSTTIADRLLLFILILLSSSGVVFVKEILPKGRTVQIEADSLPVYRLPIDEEKTVSVKGPHGNTIVEIKNHKVRIIESPCPNKLCIQQGWIESGAVVCLPNRVVVIIGDIDSKDREVVDAVT